MARHTSPAVIVNSQMNVLDVRGRPGPFLAITPGTPTMNVLRMAHSDFHLVARVTRGEGGEPVFLVGMEDVTTRKRAERLLESDHERMAGQVRSATEVLGRTREELQALAARSFTSQEEERRRVARELHDDVSQRLAALGMELDRLHQNPPSDRSELQPRLEALQNSVIALGDEGRAISHRLHPSAIEHLGLPSALRSLVKEFGEREGMLATFRCSNVPEALPLEVAGPLYRIAQEALRNAAKHAGQTHVKVALQTEDHSLTLHVRDFGEGFDIQGAEIRGLGFISMSERARLAGGNFLRHVRFGRRNGR